MAFFKGSLLKVNGFNEDFVGWGREDTELTVRLLNAGVKRKNIKFNANTGPVLKQVNNERWKNEPLFSKIGSISPNTFLAFLIKLSL